jgi:hypothetical protein
LGWKLPMEVLQADPQGRALAVEGTARMPTVASQTPADLLHKLGGRSFSGSGLRSMRVGGFGVHDLHKYPDGRDDGAAEACSIGAPSDTWTNRR